MLGIIYDTNPKKVEEAKSIVKDIILKNKDTEDGSEVALYDFGENALQLRVVYWIKKLDEIARIRDEINTEIKNRFDKEKIEFAFPTRTVYMKKV